MFDFLHLFSSKPSNPQIKPLALIIMDGWGIAPVSQGNVIERAHLPNLKKYFAEYPNTELIASGESVGLPANEVGNTEVGHLTIGTGRVIYQGLKRINVAIEDTSFIRNKAFADVINHVETNHSKLHIMGVLSSGNVHASLPHFYELLDVCKHAGLKNVCVHAFTDGRDADPKEGIEVLKKVDQRLQALGIGRIATVSGRYYAMDRDLRWERIQKTYEALVEAKGPTAESFEQTLQAAYAKGLSDELVDPTIITKDGKPIGTIDDNDGIIFFNFRIDRPRELTMALTMPDFENFDPKNFGYATSSDRLEGTRTGKGAFVRNKKPKNLFVVTMTNYHKNIPVNAIAFDMNIIEQPIGQTIAEHNLRQFHIAESEKERFVSFYFDGYREERFAGEDFVSVPSPKVSTYDKKPEMSVFKTTSLLLRNLHRDYYHFFVMNMANPDMVAHTGNIKASIKACEAVDKAIGEIVTEFLAVGGTVCITADHGNVEELLNYPTDSFFFTTSEGSMNTDHSNNPVPFLIINNQFHLAQNSSTIKFDKGTLSDIAPTILTLMGLPVPSQMKGKNLFTVVPASGVTTVPAAVPPQTP